MRALKHMLQERRQMPREQPIDFVDHLLEELKKEGTVVTEEISFDMIFLLLFASFDTTSTAIALLLKFVSDHPLVLNRLQVRFELSYKPC